MLTVFAALVLCDLCRLAEFRELLSSERIDREKLGKLCFEGEFIAQAVMYKITLYPGCPDKEGIRATCWKVCFHNLWFLLKAWFTI